MATTPRVFVAGATGTVGGATVGALRAAGVDVVAGVHSLEKAPSLIRLGVDVRPFEFANVAVMKDAMHGADRLFLVTPVSHETRELTAAAIEAAKASGISHIVKLSGLDVDVEPPFTFGRWHRGAERVIESSGIDWTFLRPNSFMQNFFWNAESIKEGVYYSTAGSARVSYVDARDIGEVAAKILTSNNHAGKSYRLTGPEAIGDNEIVKAFTLATGQPLESVPVPLEQTHRAMLEAGMSPQIADATIELLVRNADGGASDVSLDVERLLGRRARDFSAFVSDFIGAFRVSTTA